MARSALKRLFCVFLGLILSHATVTLAQTTSPQTPSLSARVIRPNFDGKLATPLRYRPEGADFVIDNGQEFFNRALYGGHTAFRVDGGDLPEFSLYLPGRGGTIRFAIKTGDTVFFVHQAAHITMRYRPGELLYTITDPRLGEHATFEIAALATHTTEGVIFELNGKNLSKDVELIYAYGGGNGTRGVRDGDIGTEKVPISQYFQFKPEFATLDKYQLLADGFVVTGKAATIKNHVSQSAIISQADAENWNDLPKLLSQKTDPAIKVAIGRVALTTDTPLYIGFEVLSRTQPQQNDTYLEVNAAPDKSTTAAKSETPQQDLKALFQKTRAHFTALRTHVTIDTPDPYLNAAMGALNVAADAIWDEKEGAVMHGAIAWRAKLLGWRGAYALDALGWHDRAARNIATWSKQQNTKPIPDRLPPADENVNLARNRTGLHSNGEIMGSHYDMNSVFIDALYRHLLWTGDMSRAREAWPVIERHLAWQKRLFRREFGSKSGGEKLPLYEAYASIWASDDIQYHGGGVAYQSAYNYYHNQMAARLARLLGHDPAPYEREAALIGRGMRTYLWQENEGAFGEFRDLLGEQSLHPSYGLWSFYHTLDSQVPNDFEAARMAHHLKGHLRPIAIMGDNVPNDQPYFMLPSSNWMPYTWSVNNVVMGENLHTALALWQAGDADMAYQLTRGSLLASFYMGIAPGNIGSLNYLDVYRREAQRDFADGAGVMSRTIIEGLFGVRPDALSRTLSLKTGFPKTWDRAALTHPNLQFSFKRQGLSDTYELNKVSSAFDRVTLEIPVAFEKISRVTLNGQEIGWSPLSRVGTPKITINAPISPEMIIKIDWAGGAFDKMTAKTLAKSPAKGFVTKKQGDFSWHSLKAAPQETPKTCAIETPKWARAEASITVEPVDLTPYFNDHVTNIFKVGKYVSPRSPYVSMAIPSQGIGAWAGHVKAMAVIDDTYVRGTSGVISLAQGLRFQTPAGLDKPNIVFTSQWDNYPKSVTLPLSGKAKNAYFLMAGSTNAMQSRLINGVITINYQDGTKTQLELKNPENWWPIDRDYFIDDYQFRLCGTPPVRLDLKTGRIGVPGPHSKGVSNREKIDGGAANILELKLVPKKKLKSLRLHTHTNEVIIGLMAVSLER